MFLLRLSVSRLLEEDLRDQFAVLGGEATGNAVHFLDFVLVDFVGLDFLALDQIHHVDFAGIVAESKLRLRVHDCPATSVHVVAGDSLNVLGEAHLEGSRRQYVQSRRRSVLNYESSLIGLGDYSAEPIEVVEHGIYVVQLVLYGVRRVSSILAFLAMLKRKKEALPNSVLPIITSDK